MTLPLPDETAPPAALGGGMDDAPAAPPAADPGSGPAPGGLLPPDPLSAALGVALDKITVAADLPDAVEMVHGARKAMKEYRALLRLIPGEGATLARREAAAAARGLASARDYAAALEALEALRVARRIGVGDFKAAQALIGADSPPEGDLAGCREALATFAAAARARLGAGLSAAAAATDIPEGLGRAYRQARNGRFRNAQAVHETRKDVVTHRYQMSFVAAHFGRGARRAVRAQALRDLLGAHHDIEILRPLLKDVADGLGPPATKRVENALRRQQKELRRQAKRLHARLFRRKPKAFARAYRNLEAGGRRPPEGGSPPDLPPG